MAHAGQGQEEGGIMFIKLLVTLWSILKAYTCDLAGMAECSSSIIVSYCPPFSFRCASVDPVCAI